MSTVSVGNTITPVEMQSIVRKEILLGVKWLKKQEARISELKASLESAKAAQDDFSIYKFSRELKKAENERLMNTSRMSIFYGPPGTGKTKGIEAEVEQTAEKNKLKIGFHTTYFSAYDQIAVRGLPVPDLEKQVTKWLRDECFPTEEETKDYDIFVWFLDEFTAVPRSVQTVLYRLIYEGRIEGYVMPRNVIVFAAGNDKDDRATAVDMSSAMANRAVHFDLRPNFDQWKAWAIGAGIHPMVIAYHNYNNAQNFYKLDTSDENMLKGFPTLRSWEAVSVDCYNYADTPNLLDLRVNGHVGMAVGLDFTTFFKIQKDIPNPEEILEGKTDVVPLEENVKFATLSNLVAHLLKNHTTERIERFFNYVELSTAQNRDMGYTAVHDLFRSSVNTNTLIKQAVLTKSWTKWADRINRIRGDW